MMVLSNVRKARTGLAVLFASATLILFSLFFEGAASPACGAEALISSFGTGKVVIRLYTDFFCPPCRAMEPRIERLLTELVRRNIVHLTIVNTPLNKASRIYARYFLYILNERKDFDHAMVARSALFKASLEGITDEVKLEEYLRQKGIGFKPFDATPTFDMMTNYLKSDRVTSTPTCILVEDGLVTKLRGDADIVNALERLKREAGAAAP